MYVHTTNGRGIGSSSLPGVASSLERKRSKARSRESLDTLGELPSASRDAPGVKTLGYLVGRSLLVD